MTANLPVAAKKKRRGLGKPFAPGPDPRRNLAGRPRGKTIREALLEYLSAEGIDGATHAGQIAEALVKLVVSGKHDLGALDRIILLTEDVKSENPGTARILITLDK